ncbi:polysaccharide biosynthesis/export family protein [Mucilaginibacter sp. FT3.2]|uniref:polysaccharide biosynthesis/export family protein n=1 Tax=Mucilaginibacter sp. FT3.2 TaxID=2723090 RepID=UPI0016125F5B|nr:polysaccharide biosynthesis/export family protein [Mucilaginibacter sp. FT3.2]MBB6230174.1 polysaccharide export outer membrane protein [Mucilaginibacter sp. FT3.2]
MRKTHLLKSYLILLILFVSVGFFSCSSTKNIKYFQDIPDSGQLKTIAKAEYAEPVIKVDDILTIIVQTVDPQATAPINLGNVPSVSASAMASSSLITQQPLSGYLVNSEGFVDIPILGRLKLQGLSTREARDSVYNVASKYYKNPTVIVRFANFKISVTGEVQKPGQYVVPNEKITILDAIAMAGDLSIFGKRENVLLIRENPDGTKTPYRVDLRKSSTISGPAYYLKQNDIIYVEPGKGKAAANDASSAKNYAIISSIITIIIVVVSRINFK